MNFLSIYFFFPAFSQIDVCSETNTLFDEHYILNEIRAKYRLLRQLDCYEILTKSKSERPFIVSVTVIENTRIKAIDRKRP